ncbi:MAG TPA: DUF1559 domain-containing protein [Gemmataceae bacterium]
MPPRLLTSRRAIVGLAPVLLGVAWAGSAPPALAEEPPKPLARVPADVPVFAHFRVGDVYGHAFTRSAREKMPKEFAEFERLLRKETGVEPANVETVTFYYPEIAEQFDDDAFVLTVTTRRPYDRGAILATAAASVPKSDNPELHPLTRRQVVHFAGPRTFTVLERGLAERYLKAAPDSAKKGPLSDAIALAASGEYAAVAGFNLKKFQIEMLLAMPPAELRPYLSLLKSESIVGLVKAGADVRGEARLQSADEANAKDAEEALGLLLRLAEQQLEVALGGADGGKWVGEGADFQSILLRRALRTLKTAKVVRQGGTVTASAELDLDAELVGAFARWVVETRGRVEATVSRGNLTQVGIALHNYHSQYKGLPPAAIMDRRGKPLLSWRVAILPYLEREELYKQFKLDEPWDSEHNRKLLEKMPRVYFLPGVNKPGDTVTHYRAVTGEGAGFDRVLPLRIPSDFADGTSNTILVVEAAEAVPWTKPDELEYDPEKPLPKLLFGPDDTCNVLLCDGSTRAIKKTISETTLRRAITRNDGYPLGPDF